MKKIKLLFTILIIVLVSEILYSQYYECQTGITTELKSSSCSRGNYNSPFKGWACGVNGVIIKSTNNPTYPWINVSGNGIPSNVTLNNINALDTSLVFVCGYLNANTWVWKTTNSGLSWIQIFNQPNGMINAIMMKNSQKGFLVGNPVNGRWSLWKTTNGGNNWDSSGLFLPQSGSELGFNNSLCVGSGSDSNKIWFGTNNSRIYYSSNYGMNWTAQSTAPEQNSFFISLTNLVNLKGITGGSNYLLRTTNYGMNWVQETNIGSGNFTGFAHLAFEYIITRGNCIYRFISYGNWYLIYTAPSGTYNYVDNILEPTNLDHYAVRNNGGITFLFETEGIKKLSNNIPKSFSLSQNYPNPFNPTTNVQFAIPNVQLVTLKIYDIHGNEVSTLVNEQLKPGSYEVEWDGDNFASGVYYYTLQAESFNQTKRMVLIK